jgi:DNA polymerase III alpha subunit
MKSFVSPHVHPQSLDSASTPEAFAKREVELGSGAITCTDHGTLGAAHKIYKLGHENGLVPIIGLEAYLRPSDCSILNKLGVPKTMTVPKGNDRKVWLEKHPNGTYFDYSRYFHLTLGFLDYKAYLCAVRLLSKADDNAEQHGSERKPIFDWCDIEELAAHNVTAGSSCLSGAVSRHLVVDHLSRDSRVQAAKQYFEHLNHLFYGRFFVEQMPHVYSHEYIKSIAIEVENLAGKQTLNYYFGKKLRTNLNEPEGISAEDFAVKYDRKKHLELVAVRNYRTWEEYPEKLKILSVEKKEGFFQNECTEWAPGGDSQWGANRFALGMAKKHGLPIIPSDDSHYATRQDKVVQDVRLAQSGGWRFFGNYARQSSDEAFEYFQKHHNVSRQEFEGWIDNSIAYAERFRGFKFETTPSLPVKFYPKDTLGYLKGLIQKNGRFINKPEYVARLKMELDVIHRNGKMDLLPYFFLAEEQVRVYANQKQLTGCGRGSAAGCLISYLIGVTHIDPLRYGLSFERFLTLDRVRSSKLPDIDLDFPDRRLFVGSEDESVDVVKFEAEDGTQHTVPENMRFETDKGLLTVGEVLEQGADIFPWWKEKNHGQ